MADNGSAARDMLLALLNRGNAQYGRGDQTLARNPDYGILNGMPGVSRYAANQGSTARAAQQRRYDGESDADYYGRMDRQFGRDYGNRTGTNQRTGEGFVKAAFSNNRAAGNEEAMTGQKFVTEEDKLNAQIQDFINRMNSPLDANDPEVRNALAMGANVGQRQSRNNGLRGGLSTAGVTRQALDALNPMRQFRQQMALQGMGLLNSREGQLAQLWQQSQGLARQRENEDWAKQQAGWQMGLAGLGTAASIVAAPFTGGATIPGAIAGGAALGNGISNYANAGKSAGSAMSSGMSSYKPRGGTGH